MGRRTLSVRMSRGLVMITAVMIYRRDDHRRDARDAHRRDARNAHRRDARDAHRRDARDAHLRDVPHANDASRSRRPTTCQTPKDHSCTRTIQGPASRRRTSNKVVRPRRTARSRPISDCRHQRESHQHYRPASRLRCYASTCCQPRARWRAPGKTNEPLIVSSRLCDLFVGQITDTIIE